MEPSAMGGSASAPLDESQRVGAHHFGGEIGRRVLCAFGMLHGMSPLRALPLARAEGSAGKLHLAIKHQAGFSPLDSIFN